MKIAIINLTGGGMSGGYRKYMKQMVPRLASHPKVSGLLVGTPETVDVSEWQRNHPYVKWVRLKRSIWPRVDVEAKKRIEEFAPDVIFIPTCGFWRMKGIPVVNMIRNMEPLISPCGGNPPPEMARNLMLNLLTRNSVANVDRIIVVSRFVGDFLITHWGVNSRKIGLVYHGVNLDQKNNGVRPHKIPEGWDGRFLFTAGLIRPYRGLEDALHAIKYLSDKSVDTPGLVIAGETHPWMRRYMKKLENWIYLQGLSSRICWAGHLNEMEMTWCYRNCAIFLMTTRVEACPNTALEAMSQGCLSIAPDTPPMPEIFGDAALFYSLGQGKALGELIRNVLAWDDHRRMILSAKGRQRAAEFSWDVTVEKTLAELENAVQCFRSRNNEEKN